jgi:hypothetical protein
MGGKCRRRVYKYHLRCDRLGVDRRFCTVGERLAWGRQRDESLPSHQKHAYYIRRRTYKRRFHDVTIDDIREKVRI